MHRTNGIWISLFQNASSSCYIPENPIKISSLNHKLVCFCNYNGFRKEKKLKNSRKSTRMAILANMENETDHVNGES